jgi:hypothetical protein
MLIFIFHFYILIYASMSPSAYLTEKINSATYVQYAHPLFIVIQLIYIFSIKSLYGRMYNFFILKSQHTVHYQTALILQYVYKFKSTASHTPQAYLYIKNSIVFTSRLYRLPKYIHQYNSIIRFKQLEKN